VKPNIDGGVRRIALLRPNHRLGNALLLTPALNELARQYPDASVDVVTSGRAGTAVFAGFANVADVLSFPRLSCRAPLATLKTFSELRSRRYDLAIDPMPHSRSGRFLLSTVNAHERVGYSDGCYVRDRVLTRSAHIRHAPKSYAEIPVHLLRHTGRTTPLPTPDSTPACPRIALSADERLHGAHFLSAANGGQVTLAVFANATGSKCYSRDWWRAVLERVRHPIRNLNIVEFVPDDNEPRLPGLAQPKFTRDLRLLGSALAAASLVVSADCGVMHLADAADASVLGLFKTTDPLVYGPRNARSTWMNAADSNPAEVAARVESLLRARRI
jgi:heptosyltransferase III